MAVRELNGSSDDIVTAIGALSGMTHGTVVALLKPDDVSASAPTQVFFSPHTSGGTGRLAWYLEEDFVGLVVFNGSPSFADTPTGFLDGGWQLLVARKATGSAVGRVSAYSYTSDTWDHANLDSALGNPTSPGAGGSVRFSHENDVFLAARVAARAAWSNSLPWSADASGDAAIEAAGLETSLLNWLLASPDELWRFNQPYTTDEVHALQGGSAHQTSISGTTVVTGDDPPGFDFGLSPEARHSFGPTTTSSAAATTNSVQPTADSLLLVFWGAQRNAHTVGEAFQTPSGGGHTYTQRATTSAFNWDGSSSFAIAGACYSAPVGGSPSAHTVTVDSWSTESEGLYSTLTCDITGFDAVDPIEQTATNGASTAEGDGHSGTVTLGTAPATGNLVIVLFGAGADSGGGFAAPTIGGQAMTQLFNQNGMSYQQALYYRVIDGAESNAVITCSDVGNAVGNWLAIAVEVNADAGGALVTGSMAETQEAQTSTSTGWAEATGTVVETQDDQTAAITGQAEILGSIAETQDDQTSDASGFVGVQGSLAETQEDQTSDATGVIGVTGSLDQTSDDQTMSATGTSSGGAMDVVGTLGRTQDDQAMAAVAWAEATGTVAAVQDDQMMTAVGLTDVEGLVAAAQGDQVMTARGGTGIQVQAVDIRPRRSKLGSRVFPVRWPADKN